MRGLHACLSLLPKRLEVPTLKQVDPVYNLLERLGGEVSGTLDLLSSVSQELMNFTLTVPGVSEGGGGREGGRGWERGEGETVRSGIWDHNGS